MSNADATNQPPNDPSLELQTANGDERTSASFLIVGIGASAGGLEAFQAFFRHMDENSGMAFVLISHLSPDHESLLSELVGKETRMNVLQAQDQALVQPNQVYVIPPNASLTIAQRRLQLTIPSQARGHRAPIDVFFRSLAEDQGENAVCVILSGTGSDGTLGLKSIKEFGGLAIAQDSQTARYDSMPRSAVLTGLIDYVLPVEEIPAKLIEYARHRDGLRASLGEGGIFAETADRLSQICSLLRRRLGHDFSGYKQNTLIRRIQRRIQITQIGSVASYVEYLTSDPDEINLLFKDLLIGVTHFFRDPESFEALKQAVIAPLVTHSQAQDSIRVWVAGCSSGEEAYTIAMLLSEEMEQQDVRSRVQIFATDIDERALSSARQARYPENIADQLTAERLDTFFEPQNGVYQVVKSLREMCIFSQHSLINDPPFSRLDLLSCRNLLIYFDNELQRKLIPLFHYALKPRGYLFLGSSENLTGHSELFRTLNKGHRIFQQKQAMLPPQVDFPLVDRSQYRQATRPNLQPNIGRQQQVTRSIERLLLQDYTPACVIINEHSEVVYFFGRTGKYLEPSPGVPSNNLFDLARRGLRLDLRAAIQSVTTTQDVCIREQVSVETEERIQLINIIVRPVRDAVEDSGLLMVIFQDVGMATPYERIDISDPQGEAQMIQQLEDELRTTKEHLRSTIEELETSNEELKSANEELLSMNEELQSSNEELQTSKEEMQSINEELETVNAELRNKIEELDTANSDIQNLFESTRIATVFLDLNLRIKKFTPAATRLFSFIETDLGRPITDIALSLADVDVAADVREVLQTLVATEREVQVEGQSVYYKMRVLPYRTIENVIDGAVITFMDITDLRHARYRAEQSAQRQRAIAELGIYALQSADAQAICDRATQLVCETLTSDLCGLFVCQTVSPADPAGDSPQPPFQAGEAVLLLKSGNGWQEDQIGVATLSATDSHPGYTLATQQPVVVDDFAQESRFSQSDLLQSCNITSGISAIVYNARGPYGVLTTHTAQPHTFTAEDVSFLQAIANGLAASLQREKNTLALQAADRRKDEFIAALGHELRNPLNALSSSIALMHTLSDRSRLDQLHVIARRQLKQLTYLIDDLLDISRIAYGKIRLRQEPLDLTQLLQNLMADHQESLAEKGLQLEIRLPERPVWVNGDRARLTQTFSNILGNAVKFSNPGGQIQILTRLDDWQISIQIVDTGIGIEPDALSRIFEAFRQEERSLARSGGLGLGLPLAKGIIER
ncbi:MAG: chemotaxis protein CheB, partial [Cyanobacteria bacterium P01_A01_bin.114]